MLIVLRQSVSDEQITGVVRKIELMGLRAHEIPGSLRTAIGITGNQGPLDPAEFEVMPGVLRAIPVTQAFKLVSREVKPEDTVIKVAGRTIGGSTLTLIAGPCAVESREQTIGIARRVKKAGAHFLRGGAFKPRTSPYSFQGLGEEGLKILAAARDDTGLPIITEALDTDTVGLVAEYADVIQIGARNMQNFSLLKRVGRTQHPVMLKRGMSATIDELLMSAEYIAAEGNYEIFLCERGVRTFSNHARNTLDLSAITAVKRLSHLPIIVDPSHGTGMRDSVCSMARAGAAAGADGLMIEVHDRPEKALSDGPQAIYPDQFDELVRELKAIAEILGRTL